MLELEPPEVPIENSPDTAAMQPKSVKRGFFQKLFSKKPKEAHAVQSIETLQQMPDIVPGINSPADDSSSTSAAGDISMPENPSSDKTNYSLPELPPLDASDDLSSDKNSKKLGKAKGKKGKDMPDKKYMQYDLHRSFDWTEPIGNQQDYVKDSNRNNPDIAALLDEAKRQVASQQSILSSQSSLSSSEELPSLNIDSPKVYDTPEEQMSQMQKDTPSSVGSAETTMLPTEMPAINPIEQKEFMKIEHEHKKLRNELSKKINDPKFLQRKQEFKELLNKYDDKIEKRIEQKQLELSDKRTKLDKFHKLLSKKEAELRQLHDHLKNIDAVLNKKQSTINEIVNKAVNKQLMKRSAKEKALLNREIRKTLDLNKRLQHKLDIIEKDRIAFEKKKDKLLTEERVKINASQEIYEKKLKELDIERKDFEAKRQKSLVLLSKGDALAKDLQEISQLRNTVEKDKRFIKKEVLEDKELKRAISNAEKRIVQEKTDLDNAVFSKYIASKLSNIQPEALHSEKPDITSLNIEYENDKIYTLIKECKQSLLQSNIANAKIMYNKIKRLFETTHYNKIEKRMLYNNIRALYNEIQLAVIDDAE